MKYLCSVVTLILIAALSVVYGQGVVVNRPIASNTFMFSDTVFRIGMLKYLPGLYYSDKGSFSHSLPGKIDSLVNFLLNNPRVKVEIQLHQFGGNPAYILKQSQHMANLTRDYMFEKGILETKFNIDGYGGEKPLIPYDLIRAYNDPSISDAARKLNTRIEVRIVQIE